MSCAIHKKDNDVKKCPVCQKSMCEQCANFCEKYGACPNCLKRQSEMMFDTSKRGVWYAGLGLVCATVFLILYVIEICLGKIETTFIIIGTIILAVLLPLTIFLLLFSIKRIKVMKNFLSEEINKKEK